MLKFNLLSLLLLLATVSYSQVHMPAFFSDNMVLQQQTMASIWGTDTPNTEIRVSGDWNESASTTTDENGKWKVKLQTPEAGGPYTLKIEGSNEVVLENVLIGEVWLCSGQSNMQMPVKGFNNQPVEGSNEAVLNSSDDNLRLFTVERNPSLVPVDDVSGEWSGAGPQSVKDFSATAYFFGQKIREILNVPVGLISDSWGGSKVEAWMDEETLSEFKNIEMVNEIPSSRPQHAPALLYNGMLRPLEGFAIKGVIWYQGESNRNEPEKYSRLFPAMIQQWRTQWQQEDMPFYFVQIAPYGYGDEGNAGFVREAQLKTMQTVENTGMVVTLDIGDCDCIHPAKKRTVGERLAYWALAKDYNYEEIAFTGPVYSTMETNDEGEVILSFDNCPNGLTSFDKPLSGFEIAGKDKVFHPATAKINKDRTITVSSGEVSEPVAVRYGFENCPEGTLFNTEGLPASSFRTDEW